MCTPAYVICLQTVSERRVHKTKRSHSDLGHYCIPATGMYMYSGHSLQLL